MPDTKPTVHYVGDAVIMDSYAGRIARLFPIDHPNHHPNHDISNGEVAFTSPVVAHNLETGRIETRNTIYVRAELPKADAAAETLVPEASHAA